MLTIGDKRIGNTENCFIIAEIGQNHQGNIELAKEMILKAKECGADCVKFQKSCLTEKFTANALNREYTSKNSFGLTYGEHKQYLEFTIEQFQLLQLYANDINILFTASAMDLISFRQLADELLRPVPFIKIGSGDANNFELIELATNHPKYKQIPLVISTGMQNEYTIKQIHKLLGERTNWCLLHCVSAYPTTPIDTNLRTIELYRKWFPNIIIGYSGHEQSTAAISSTAYLLGAAIIERHFTMDKKQKGTDHCLSLEPHEFLQFTQSIRKLDKIKTEFVEILPANTINILNILKTQLNLNPNELWEVQQSLDDDDFTDKKRIFDCELECWQKLGKSLVYRKAIMLAGERITKKDIVMKVSHPKGLSSDYYYKILGKQLRRNVCLDEPIQWNDFYL